MNSTEGLIAGRVSRLVRRWLTAKIRVERLPDSYRKTVRRLEGRLRAWDVEYRPYRPEHDDSITRDRWPAMPALLRIWIADRWLIRISPNAEPIHGEKDA